MLATTQSSQTLYAFILCRQLLLLFQRTYLPEEGFYSWSYLCIGLSYYSIFDKLTFGRQESYLTFYDRLIFFRRLIMCRYSSGISLCFMDMFHFFQAIAYHFHLPIGRLFYFKRNTIWTLGGSLMLVYCSTTLYVLVALQPHQSLRSVRANLKRRCLFMELSVVILIQQLVTEKCRIKTVGSTSVYGYVI